MKTMTTCVSKAACFCLRAPQVETRGYLAAPHPPLGWSGPEARAPEPCPPRERGRSILAFVAVSLTAVFVLITSPAL